MDGSPLRLVERLNGTLRRECLNLKVFQTTTQLQAALDDWWQVYNFERPHSALRYQTPDTVYQTSVKFQHTMVTA
ncbi:transposase [Larkinella bovis]|uniref:Transposase n=1 Tax=Larkinella bovis TaxID=683041 RepID=A0ABW0IBH0_9BACT